LRISLHAGRGDTWALLRGVKDISSFEKLKNTIRTITASNRCSVAILQVINKINFNEVSEMVEIVPEVGAQELSLGRLNYFKNYDLNEEEKMFVVRKLYSKNSFLKKHKIKHNIDAYLRSLIFTKRKNPFSSKCLAGWYFSTVLDTGHILFCPNGSLMGNLKNGGFYNTWNSKYYKKTRQNLAYGKYDESFSDCKTCCLEYVNEKLNKMLLL